jgi:hypothetical protein
VWSDENFLLFLNSIFFLSQKSVGKTKKRDIVEPLLEREISFTAPKH